MAEPKAKLVNNKPYPDVEPSPDFAQLEHGILKFWKENNTFKKSVDFRNDGSSSRLGNRASLEQAERHPTGALENATGGIKEFIFYDGPPFANGLPHYGHLLTGFVKDLFARYQTMKGKKVERRFGWDCHGMPAEMAAEKELGISGKMAIEKFGIENFNAHCEKSVMKYAGEWETYVNRQARWVDFENDYKTMDIKYMESVMWAFNELYKKGLIYESHRVMPYSWAMETPVSNFETRMDNAYRERTDKAITVAFEFDGKPNGAPDAEKYFMLAWTTTPWTLPSNLALGVSPKLEYWAVINPENKNCYIFAAFAANNYLEKILGTKDKDVAFTFNKISGDKLVGTKYKPLFPYFTNHKNAFKILSADFIEEGSGTGVVHLAPGFGEDDQRVCEINDIEIACPVDERGKYTAEIFDLPDLKLKGLNVVADKNKSDDEPYKPEQLEKYGLANLRIIDWLKKQNKLIFQEDYKHNYPHCWRTDTPLIYRALPSWYVEVTKFNNRMVELNQQINWIPEHIKEGRFGKWLEGARDWSISRNRYWGAPIPIWRTESGKIKSFGSIKELEDFFGEENIKKAGLGNPASRQPGATAGTPSEKLGNFSGENKITNLHRPFIDNLTKTENGETWKRVPDVLDCWFESGSMPFAQVHYPFENKEWFETHFPADFIVEYEAQTRGWFYTLMVLGTALFDKPPFKNVICHGVVLDDKGQKLSKSKGNYVDPKEIFEKYGADSLRWLMLSSPIMHGNELYIDKEGKFIRDVVRLYIKPIWNAYNFFTLYANADEIKAKFNADSTNLMDRYILAKLREAVIEIEKSLDSFNTPPAYKAVENFFEVLNNWYIRRTKERFWKKEKDEDKQTAYDTLYTCLVTMCRAAASLLPLVSEEIFKGLTNKESVHLENFPDTSELFPANCQENFYEKKSEWEFVGKAAREDYIAITRRLQNDMDRVRDICNAALSVRNKENIRVRQPLTKLTVVGKIEKSVAEFVEIIKDEVNIKNVEFAEDVSKFATLTLKINFPVLGKRLPEKMKQIIPASKKGEWKKLENGKVEILGETLEKDECELLLEPKDKKGTAPLSTNDALVILDLTITKELEQEGLARDIVRMVQQARKDANLVITDKINLNIKCSAETQAAINSHAAYIKEQTLSNSLLTNKEEAGTHKFENDLDGEKITLAFSKL